MSASAGIVLNRHSRSLEGFARRALARAGVTLGETYPRPIVERTAARTRALEAFVKMPLVADR